MLQGKALASLSRNTIYNLASNVLPAVASMVSVPYLYKAIGNEEYGVLTLILSLLSYFALFDFGVGRVITQYVAHHSNNESSRIGGVVLGAGITLIASLVGYYVTYQLSGWFTSVMIKPSREIEDLVESSIAYSAYFIPIICVGSLFKGVIEGCEKFWLTSLVRVIAISLVYIAPVIMLLVREGNLESVIKCILIVRIIELLALMGGSYSILRKWCWKKVTFDSVTIFKNSSWMTLSNLISPIMVLSDRFYVSWAMGAGLVSVYTIPMDLLLKFLVVPASITSAAYPRFAKDIKESLTKFNHTYDYVNRTLKKLVVGILVPVGICIYWFMSIWINENFAQKTWKISIILIVGIGFNSLAQLPYNAIQSFGKIHTTTKIHALELLIYLPCILILGSYIGLYGVAIAWTTRSIIDYCLLNSALKRIVYEYSNRAGIV